MDKIRNSDFLKILCYILIPILAAILVICIMHIEYLKSMNVTKEQTKYTQTENFAESYLSFCISKTSQIQNAEMNRQYIEIQDSQQRKIYYTNQEQYNKYYDNISSYINYIIVDKETETIYTNVKSSDYQTTMQNIKNNDIYWNYVNDKIETNIEFINQENIKYNYNYYYSHYYQNKTSKQQNQAQKEKIQEETSKDKIQEETPKVKELQDFDIYTFFDQEKLSQQIGSVLNLYEFIVQNKNIPIYIGTIVTFLLLIIAIYLFWAIGHKKGKEIELGMVDKIPYELISIISAIILIQSLKIIYYNLFEYYGIYAIIASIAFYFIGYTACCVFGVTTIKRIKANKLWESFLIYKIVRWTYRTIKSFLKEIAKKTTTSKKTFLYYWSFIVISIILTMMISRKIIVFILIAFWIYVYYKLRKYERQQNDIKEALQQIYEGKTDVYLNEEELKGILKDMAIYINDISGGFANSIEEKLKSEKLKAELITNVSHDIKTPLTSIINYVDLLKKENIQNEKIREYIAIIDTKSQRLKKLTEDVIDASKASSGNLKLNIEEINIKELLNQTIGEYKDKFEEKHLKIETNISNNNFKINADSRYMYRIIENLFSNLTKYALENSRVYIDVKNIKEAKETKTTKEIKEIKETKETKATKEIKDAKSYVQISIKNISKARLNISSDELMQRFVRGDKSRYTEGSGLGLSIAKSLTELQNGQFNIIIDGDLFKVVMIWPRCN